jgi:hypothetical protein
MTAYRLLVTGFFFRQAPAFVKATAGHASLAYGTSLWLPATAYRLPPTAYCLVFL